MENNIIQTNIPLTNKNWFNTGGPAAFYAAPKDANDFAQALQYAKENDLELFLLGKGANILISDTGFNGFVLHPKIDNIWHEDLDAEHALVHAGAGVDMNNLINYCLQHNLTGLEELSGIPGAVGGSVYMNIHYFTFSLGDFLFGATLVHKDTFAVQQVDQAWFNFKYNYSRLMERNHYLTHATFKLKKSTNAQTAFAKGRKVEIIRHRNARYPNTKTCGSFFRNFFDTEVTLHVPGSDKKMIYVAYYLDKIGVKGHLSVGDAVVSHQHANMIVNKGNATSSDIIAVAKQMQTLVKTNFGIVPQPECQLIGFKTYPLLR